ncbi:MAG: hypothetical protein LCH37_02800 [Bacteroidetes bacterium]|nr:hypothetical protein [Bacteroidota bacterium]
MKQVLLILAAIAALVFVMYKLVPRLSKSYSQEKLIKLLLFLVAAGYLAIDFYLKEKYMYLFILGLGSFGFISLLKAAKRKDQSGNS